MGSNGRYSDSYSLAMERGTQQAIPWQGLVTSNGHHSMYIMSY